MTKLKLILIYLFFLCFNSQAQNQPEAWQLLSTGTNADLYSVHCINKDTVFACGSEGTVIKSLDGGENWTSQNTGTNVLLKKIRFANDTIGFAVGETGTIIKTTDAGETWTQLTSGTSENLNSVFCLDKDTVYAVGNNGTLLKTTDGGGIWNGLTVGTIENLMDVAFPVANKGYVVGHGVSVTENFGESWIYYENGYFDYRSIYFSDSFNGYLGSQYTVDATFDGGDNWDICLAWGENSEFRDVEATNSGTVYFVGMYYTYQPYAIILMNFGSCNENELYYYENENEYQYNSVDFITDSIGYVAGFNGIIRKTIVAGYDTTSTSTIKIPKDKIEIYPNPTSDNFVIKSNSIKGIITISIYSSSGILISEKQYSNTESIPVNLEAFPQGIYYVSLKTSEYITTKKIIKH